jgi:hypothetical protein
VSDIFSVEELQELANIAFEAVLKNTGVYEPHATVCESYNSFNRLVTIHGLDWLIDATRGTGMSHFVWTCWMSCAKEGLEKK